MFAHAILDIMLDREDELNCHEDTEDNDRHIDKELKISAICHELIDRAAV